ncbi:pentatricopeptide repeat domain-containing protein [Colletotrichum salicis]|uniref:Pentatricopeptide repeat domain-containing protein n=1 Tax=Colletotrichum salicis TaxID=1209931 RepID=A0A135V4J8_9PEZI|nr:pentatricopeptide repeat domain-containing protein [Colletotrichum salicis]
MAASEQKPKVKLYWLEQSRAQNILWLLEELKIDYEIEVFHRNKQTLLAPPELAKVHPLGKSPVIEIFPTGSGESIKLAESGYMTQYLCEHFGQNTNLIPKKWKDGQEGKIGGETEEYSRCQYLLHYIEGSLLPVLTLSLVIGALKSDNVPFLVRPITSLVANRIYSMMVFPNAKKHMAMIDQMLETSPNGGKYICGEHLSAADILLSFALIAAQPRFDGLGSWPGGSAKAAHPRVFEYIERLKKEPGYERSAQKIREIDGKFEATISKIIESDLRMTYHRRLARFIIKVSSQSSCVGSQTPFNPPTATEGQTNAMLASRTVCAQCRSRLLAGAATIGAVRSNSTTSFPSAAVDQPSRTPKPKAPRPPTRKTKGGGNETARQRVLDLFEETVSKEPAPATPSPGPGVNQLYSLTDELSQLLQQRQKEKISDLEFATQAYTFITTKLLVAAQQSGVYLPQVTTTIASQAIQQITKIKFAAIEAADLPQTVDICKLYTHINNRRVMRRLELINGLLRAIISSRADPENQPVEDRLLEDLVECWKHFSGLKRADSGLESDPVFWLTSRRDLLGTERPDKLLRALFPFFAANETSGLGPALVATYVLLSESKHMITKARVEAHPLLEALDRIVKQFDKDMLQELFRDHAEVWSYVQPRADWRVTRVAPGTWKELDTVSTGKPDRAKSAVRFSYALWHRRFETVFRANDTAAIQQAWRDLINPANDKDRTLRLQSSPDLFDYILFLTCSKYGLGTSFSKLTEEILAYMKTLGMAPTVRTYTSMMSGWKEARRLEPIENLWKFITNAGVKLDQQIWSSRISALGLLGGEHDGLGALKEMDRLWNMAVKNGAQGKAVEPGISNVNSAISGLLRRDNMEVIRTVLDWATDKGIKPDIYTYNMLLSRMLKKGAHEEADRILASMKTAGITPDGATFTVIMEAALSDLPDQTPQEQRETMDRVFSEMAACGIEPNQESFGKMLHVLVRAGDSGKHAVAALLSHLRASRLHPSTEMCTMLVEYYVNRNRPDLDSLRALVADRRARTRALTDRVFWESVIKNYHRAGDLDSALEVVYDLDDWGIWPGLPLLDPLLRSLVHRHDFEGAKKLVDTVRKQARPQAADKAGRYSKHGFWAFAHDYHLLPGQEEA